MRKKKIFFVMHMYCDAGRNWKMELHFYVKWVEVSKCNKTWWQERTFFVDAVEGFFWNGSEIYAVFGCWKFLSKFLQNFSIKISNFVAVKKN